MSEKTQNISKTPLKNQMTQIEMMNLDVTYPKNIREKQGHMSCITSSNILFLLLHYFNMLMQSNSCPCLCPPNPEV